MKRYKVTLSSEERIDLEAITHKGSHESQKVLNALILLNTDEGEFNMARNLWEDVANILRISMRKIDRVKKRFVEFGIALALGRKPTTRQYESKVDGALEAHLVAMSCGAPPASFITWSLRLLADRAVKFKYEYEYEYEYVYVYVESLSYETVRRVLTKTKLNRGAKLAG